MGNLFYFNYVWFDNDNFYISELKKYLKGDKKNRKRKEGWWWGEQELSYPIHHTAPALSLFFLNYFH